MYNILIVVNSNKMKININILKINFDLKKFYYKFSYII